MRRDKYGYRRVKIEKRESERSRLVTEVVEKKGNVCQPY